MTTDEGTSNNGENPTAAVLEQGEDITTKKDRGVLKVRHRGAQRGSPALREGEVGSVCPAFLWRGRLPGVLFN